MLFGWRRIILIFLQPHCYLLVCLYTALLFVGLIESLDIVWEELALGGSKFKGRPSLQLALFCLYSQFSHILIVCFCEGSEIWWANVVPILLALWAVNPKQLKFLYLSNFRVRIIFFWCAVMRFHFNFVESIVFAFEGAVYVSSWLFHFYFLLESYRCFLFHIS